MLNKRPNKSGQLSCMFVKCILSRFGFIGEFARFAASAVSLFFFFFWFNFPSPPSPPPPAPAPLLSAGGMQPLMLRGDVAMGLQWQCCPWAFPRAPRVHPGPHAAGDEDPKKPKPLANPPPSFCPAMLISGDPSSIIACSITQGAGPIKHLNPLVLQAGGTRGAGGHTAQCPNPKSSRWTRSRDVAPTSPHHSGSAARPPTELSFQPPPLHAPKKTSIIEKPQYH